MDSPRRSSVASSPRRASQAGTPRRRGSVSGRGASPSGLGLPGARLFTWADGRSQNGAARARRLLHNVCRAADDAASVRELVLLCADSLDAMQPEPTIVAWARGVCDGRLLLGGAEAGARALAVLDELLAASANINARGRDGETALHVAASALPHNLGSSDASARNGEPPAFWLWYQLLARGASNECVDCTGERAVQRLSFDQCYSLLSSKRPSYGIKHIQRLRANPQREAGLPPRPSSARRPQSARGREEQPRWVWN